jgi:hypothetical protein
MQDTFSCPPRKLIEKKMMAKMMFRYFLSPREFF